MFLSSYAMQQCIYCTYPSIPLAEINVIYALIVHGLVVYRNICRKYEALLVSWHSTVIKDAINERKTRLGTHIPEPSAPLHNHQTVQTLKVNSQALTKVDRVHRKLSKKNSEW